jgi:hypothetical protein
LWIFPLFCQVNHNDNEWLCHVSLSIHRFNIEKVHMHNHWQCEGFHCFLLHPRHANPVDISV